MKVPGQPFCDKYKDLTDKLKRHMFKYVKSLRSAADQVVNDGAAVHEITEEYLNLDNEGWPVLTKIQKWSDIHKQDLENVFRRYMNQHYCTLHLHPMSGQFS